MDDILVASRNTAVTPLLTYLSYHILALSHRRSCRLSFRIYTRATGQYCDCQKGNPDDFWLVNYLHGSFRNSRHNHNKTEHNKKSVQFHDDVIKWKHFPRSWPFVRGIHRSPVNSPHKGQWRGALIFSLICVWINGWVNHREAGDLRRYRAHYDVSVLLYGICCNQTLH